MSLSEPLTPPDCDCRGLPFMPLEVSRLMESDFTALSTGDEFKAGLMLWAKSWTQVPAASLPNDDRILAHLVNRSLADWLTVKEMALHNWIRCADGRLYHPVIADLALKAAEKRKGQAERANSRWAKVRAAKNAPDLPSDMPRDEKPDAAASESDAPAMQVKGTSEVEEEPPKAPQGADLALVPEEPAVDQIAEAVAIWNDLAKRAGLPMAKTVDAGRRKAITKRLEDGGLGAWREAVAAVGRSRHCRGENERHWRADIDFVCQPKSWRRLLEGTYGDDAPPLPEPKPLNDAPPPDPWRRRVEAFVRNQHWNRLEWGPPPGKPDCAVSIEILAACGFGGEGVVPFAKRSDAA